MEFVVEAAVIPAYDASQRFLLTNTGFALALATLLYLFLRIILRATTLRCFFRSRTRATTSPPPPPPPPLPASAAITSTNREETVTASTATTTTVPTPNNYKKKAIFILFGVVVVVIAGGRRALVGKKLTKKLKKKMTKKLKNESGSSGGEGGISQKKFVGSQEYKGGEEEAEYEYVYEEEEDFCPSHDHRRAFYVNGWQSWSFSGSLVGSEQVDKVGIG
jgi:hypothetical protein